MPGASIALHAAVTLPIVLPHSLDGNVRKNRPTEDPKFPQMGDRETPVPLSSFLLLPFLKVQLGQISQEVYLVKICLLFSKFGQSLLENGQLSRLKFPPPLF